MRKYMKYEIKGTYRFILGIIAAMLIASTVIQGIIARELKMVNQPTSMGMGLFGGIMSIVSILVIFGAFIAAIFYIVNSFKKELYEERGYLTFTLPLTGNKIVGGKLIIAFMWNLVLGLAIFLYNLLLALILHGSNWVRVAKDLLNNINPGLVSLGVVFGLSAIMTLVLIYFSMALSRVSVKNKKIGGLWFIIFLILNSALSFITIKVSNLFPYLLNLSNLKISHYYDIIAMSGFEGMGQMILIGTNYNAYINIMGNLTQIIISAMAFVATGYMIEKKIDL